MKVCTFIPGGLFKFQDDPLGMKTMRTLENVSSGKGICTYSSISCYSVAIFRDSRTFLNAVNLLTKKIIYSVIF